MKKLMLMLTCGKGRYKIFLIKKEVNDDLLIILGGGDKTHIGGIVFREQRKKPKTVKFKDHYDYIALEIIAKAACKKYRKNVVVTGGIHIENATYEDINKILDNCKKLAEKI